MEWQQSGLLLMGLLFAALLTGLPIFVALGLVSFFGILILMGPGQAFHILGTSGFDSVRSFVFITVPLYVLLAEIILFSGFGSGLYDAISKWLGRLPGGLAVASTFACGVMGALVGTSTAAVASIGLVAIPEMIRKGYNRKLAVGSIGGSGGLAILIPPSIPMILYAIIAEQSIGRLFLAGYLPGLVLAVLIAAVIFIWVKKDPTIAPPVSPVPFKEMVKGLVPVWPVVLIIGLVMVTIYTGISTASEAGAVAVVVSLVLCILMKKFSWHSLREALTKSVVVTSFMFMIIISALLFGFLITYMGIPQGLAQWLVSLPLEAWVVLIFLQLFYLVLGCFLDVAAIIIITTPVLFPVVQALGFDPIWYGILLMVNMQCALITPPVGFNLFLLRGLVADISFGDIVRGTSPFLFAQVLCLAVLIAFPPIVTVLPNMFMGIVK